MKPRAVSSDADHPLPGGDGSFVALHEIIRRKLADRILRGTLEQGATLPGETYLAQEYEVGVGTIRRALSALVAEGLLTRRRKTGTVVTGRAPNHRLGMIYQFFRLHRAGTTLVTSDRTILGAARRKASMDEAQQLRLGAGALVIDVHRLRSVGGAPVMHEHIVMPDSLLPRFPDQTEVPPRLYVYLLEHYGLRIAAQRENLRAELANEVDITMLGLQAPAAVLVINAVAYGPTGRPIIVLTQRASTEDYFYVNELQQ